MTGLVLFEQLGNAPSWDCALPEHRLLSGEELNLGRGAQPVSGFTTHVALRAGREEPGVPSRAVLSAARHAQLAAFILQPKKQKKIKSPEVN